MKILIFILFTLSFTTNIFGSITELPSKYLHLKKVKLVTVLTFLQSKNKKSNQFSLESIEYLDASWHQLDHVDFVHILVKMPNLKVLDLSHNELSKISVDQFKLLGKVKRLDLSHNRLKDMDRIPFKELEELEELDISNNLISFGIIPTNESIASLDISNNLLKELSVKGSNTFLKYLNLANNKFRIRKEHSSKLTNLMYIDISNNGIDELKNEEIDFPSLKTLILHKNPLNKLPDNINETLQLKELDISETNIDKLVSMPSLRKLTCGGRYDFKISDGRNMRRAALVRKKKKDKWNRKLSDLTEEANESINPFDLKPLVDSNFSLVELRIVNEDEGNFNMIFDHPNLTSLKSLHLEECGLHKFPDLSNFPHIKYLGLFGNRINQYPSKEQISQLKQLKKLDLSVRVFGFIRQRIKKFTPLEILHLRNELNETKFTYYNIFINKNCTSESVSPFNFVNIPINKKVDTYFLIYKELSVNDPELGLIALESALQYEKEISFCSERQFLLELQCIQITEKYVNSENKSVIAIRNQSSGLQKIKGSLIFTRYRKLYNQFETCDFRNRKGLNKVKAELYKGFMNVIVILEAEHSARRARIQRLINGIGKAGTVSAFGTAIAAGTFNSNATAAGHLISMVGDWAANSAEERSRYLMDINKRLSTEIVQFKQMANSFLD